MEGNLLGLNLTVLDFYLVSGEDDWDIFTDAGEITVPVGNIFVSDTRSDVKHNDGALALDVVSVAQSSELFLPSGIPNIELDRPSVGVKDKRVDLNTESGNILLFEFSSQVPLNEGSFSNSTVTDEDEFELWLIRLLYFALLFGYGKCMIKSQRLEIMTRTTECSHIINQVNDGATIATANTQMVTAHHIMCTV
jgi:hypothetical protein